MSKYDQNYLNLVKEILNEGIETPCRTGNNTLVKLNCVLTHDMKEGFPILTFRPLPFKGARAEIAGFLKGMTDKQWYQAHQCKYWDSWANPQKAPYSDKEAMLKERDLGPCYGKQWVNFDGTYRNYDDFDNNGTNQIEYLVNSFKKNPYDRRLILNAWNPNQLDQMALPPCVYGFQLNWLGNRLHMTVLQRSCDTILGVPTDLIGYALLLQLFAQTLQVEAGTITFNLCNCHIYDNHIAIVKEHLEHWEQEQYDLPKLKLDPIATVFNFEPEMAELVDYKKGPKVTFPIAV